MSEKESRRTAGWHLDLEEDRSMEMDVDSAGRVWCALSGLTSMDVWLKPAVGDIDVRVQIRRIGTDTVAVALDRGEGAGDWWSTEAAPKLVIRLDPTGVLHIVAAAAHTGTSEKAPGHPAVLEIPLGSIAVRRSE